MTAPAAGHVDEKDAAQDALTEANAEQADVQAEQAGAGTWETREGAAPASIVACPNGPLLVRGDFEIVTPDGIPVPRDRETVALCRCGGSAIKPYCDGTHKLMKFDTTRRRPVPAPARKAAEDAAE